MPWFSVPILVHSGSDYTHYLGVFMLVVFVMMIFFLVSVFFSMLYVLLYGNNVRYLGHQKVFAETLAFIFSVFALLVMAYPSLYLLYCNGQSTSSQLSVKVVGNQWYWSFEVADITDEPVLMYMLQLEDLLVGGRRFLDVDNRLVIPAFLTVQFLITSSDVVHSFAIPTLGMKVDAVPGLLTVVHTNAKKIGVHYGQCSEICGANHAYMPFVMEVVPFQSYIYWAMLNLD